jgi:hypothetical protein
MIRGLAKDVQQELSLFGLRTALHFGGVVASDSHSHLLMITFFQAHVNVNKPTPEKGKGERL